MPEMTVEGLFGLYGPKTMSVELIDQIDADVRRVADDADLPGRFERIGQSLRPMARDAFATELLGNEQKTAELARKYKAKPN